MACASRAKHHVVDVCFCRHGSEVAGCVEATISFANHLPINSGNVGSPLTITIPSCQVDRLAKMVEFRGSADLRLLG
jgi:hypothetical protein